MPNDEYLDLVDENDQVIEKKLRSEVYLQGLSNFRVINVLIRNSKGELWIPRRTAHKRLFPLGLDVSAGGHVESGEDYQSTLEREVFEEIRIDLKITPFTLLGKLTPQQGLSCFMQVYEIQSDQVPDFNPEDYFEYYWLSPTELLKRIENGDICKSDLPKIIQHFYIDQ